MSPPSVDGSQTVEFSDPECTFSEPRGKTRSDHENADRDSRITGWRGEIARHAHTLTRQLAPARRPPRDAA